MTMNWKHHLAAQQKQTEFTDAQREWLEKFKGLMSETAVFGDKGDMVFVTQRDLLIKLGVSRSELLSLKQ